MVISSKLQTDEIWSIIENGDQVSIDEETRNQIDGCFSFLESFSKDKVI